MQNGLPGTNHRFTVKEDEQAKEISKSYQEKGLPKKLADNIGYSKVNKLRNR